MCLGHGKRQVTSLGSKFCALFGYVGSRCYQSCHFWPSREVQPEAFQPKNVPEDLNEDIRVGSSLCKGCEVQIGENVVAQQVPVLDQGNLSADCAYHALKNADEIVKALNRDDDNLQEQVHCPEKARNLFRRSAFMRFISAIICSPFERTRSWQSIIQNMPGKQRHDTDWLQSDEVDYLISHADNVSQDYITVIDDTNLLGHDEFVTDKVRNKINRCKLANKLRSNYIHAFILGTMNGCRAYESCRKALGSGNGHWITLVVQQQNGKRNYIVADSKNQVRLLGEPFENLIRELEGEEIAANIDAMSRNVQQGSLALIPEEYCIDGVLETAGSILPLLKENPQSISQEEVGQVKGRIDKCMEYISVLSKRFKRDYVGGVEGTYQANFEGYSIDFKRCYELLGFGLRDAENVSLKEAQDACAARLNEDPPGPGGLSKWRQIRYPFGNSLMKQEYDAYCKGPNALLRLQQPNQVEFKYILDKYQRLIPYKAEIDGIIQQRLESP